MNIDLGWASVSLLPSAPYSVRGASRCCVLGLAFERQQGVHAIGADKHQDFDAWPGDLAFTFPGVDVFSESCTGGEYLTVHVTPDVPDLQVDAPQAGPRTVFHGDRHAVRLGGALRRLLHAAQPDPRLIEEHAALLLGQGLSRLTLPGRGPSSYAADRKAHARVLDYIDSMIDSPLSLAELAGVAQMPLLRFLRSFSNAVGSTPHAYITERRLQRARRLLRASDAPLADIAFACGFAHQSHLGAVLKERLGLSPRQYRGLAQAI
ncbi:MAG: AraC family transcriptional regulator [Pseudomonadota bacterium]